MVNENEIINTRKILRKLSNIGGVQEDRSGTYEKCIDCMCFYIIDDNCIIF